MILHRLESDCLFFCCFSLEHVCIGWFLLLSFAWSFWTSRASGLEPSSKERHWFVFFADVAKFPVCYSVGRTI